jgi:hypothetical protein
MIQSILPPQEKCIRHRRRLDRQARSHCRSLRKRNKSRILEIPTIPPKHTTMKLNPWIFPALAMLVIGGWIGSQEKTTATLEKEMQIITERIRQAASKQERNALTMAKTGRDKIGRDKNGKIDLKGIAERIAKNGYSSEANRITISQLNDLLANATVEELRAQLDEITALEIDEETKQRLRSMIIRTLADKNPEYVLTRFGSEYIGGDWSESRLVGYALKNLADKDPLGAAAWLDQQIAEGKLDSKSLDGINELRLDYESFVVRALLDSDSGAAALRLKALPENQRMQVLSKFSMGMNQSSEASFAKLVRECVPADKTGRIFAHIIQDTKFTDDIERLDGYITNIKATNEESNAIVKMVMTHLIGNTVGKRFDAEKLEKTRTWAARHSEQGGDIITGKLLAEYSYKHGMDFDKAAEIVLSYGNQSGNDEALTAFLKSPIRNETSPATLKSLIEKIKDPVIREEIVNLPQFRTLLDNP